LLAAGSGWLNPAPPFQISLLGLPFQSSAYDSIVLESEGYPQRHQSPCTNELASSEESARRFVAIAHLLSAAGFLSVVETAFEAHLVSGGFTRKSA